MISKSEARKTNEMIQDENLDVRTITMGINIPVSYTHLDVYKRQGQSPPSSRSPFGSESQKDLASLTSGKSMRDAPSPAIISR